ncbi:MAG: hypothetical protein ACLPSH_10625 [Vulcanimicrobiaceae bacterium]
MAMVIGLLSYVPDPRVAQASRAIYESVLETVHQGLATSDLGGHASTSQFRRRHRQGLLEAGRVGDALAARIVARGGIVPFDGNTSICYDGTSEAENDGVP